MTRVKTSGTTTLGQLLEGLVDDEVLQQHKDAMVKHLVQDNRKAGEGDLFIACQGFNTHGLLYAEDAVARGVEIILWDGDCDNRDEILNAVSNKVICIRCNDLKYKAGEIASRFYDHPSAAINVIGVTGTDGKTSIAHFLAQCLDDNDTHCGVLGTLGNGFINDLHPTGLTTVDALQIQQTLAQIRDAGSKFTVMEVSSHGLDQGRVSGVQFNTAVFSNLSRDHLDYHETADHYAAAKKKLFDMPGLKTAVINLDDAFGRELAKACRQHLTVWGYSVEQDFESLQTQADAVVRATRIVSRPQGIAMDIETSRGNGHVSAGVLGRFNASNLLAVFATLLASGYSLEDALQRLSKVHPVTGRMQIVFVPERPVVVIDYAHTAQALQAACASVREHFSGELWCVFGCGGDRDRDKRPLMAKAAEQYADHVIVTSDNPRHEDPKKIIEDIMQGFADKSKVQQYEDRRDAIRSAVAQAHKDDVILLAGKGHETSQIIGDVHIAFDDQLVARECLEAAG